MACSRILTSLQFAAIAPQVREGELSGHTLRLKLADEGIKVAGSAFYQLMNRLVRAGLIQSRLNEELIRDLAVKETFYSPTDAGREAWTETINFYRSRSGQNAPEKGEA